MVSILLCQLLSSLVKNKTISFGTNTHTHRHSCVWLHYICARDLVLLLFGTNFSWLKHLSVQLKTETYGNLDVRKFIFAPPPPPFRSNSFYLAFRNWVTIFNMTITSRQFFFPQKEKKIKLLVIEKPNRKYSSLNLCVSAKISGYSQWLDMVYFISINI